MKNRVASLCPSSRDPEGSCPRGPEGPQFVRPPGLVLELFGRRDLVCGPVRQQTLGLQHAVDAGFRYAEPGVVTQPAGQLPRGQVRLGQGVRHDRFALLIPHGVGGLPGCHGSRVAPQPPLPAVVAAPADPDLAQGGLDGVGRLADQGDDLLAPLVGHHPSIKLF
jgi:hypothetical protein